MGCGVGYRHGSDPTLLCLLRRPAATAPIQPLSWDPPYAAGVALKDKKTKKRKGTANICYNQKCQCSNFKAIPP